MELIICYCSIIGSFVFAIMVSQTKFLKVTVQPFRFVLHALSRIICYTVSLSVLTSIFQVDQD